MTSSTLRPHLQTALISQLTKTSTRKKNPLQKGFTLVELMVVIVIVAILSAVALPNFLKQTDKAKATEAKTGLAAILKQAQAGFIENGNAPSTTTGLATTAGTLQNLYGAPEASKQKFDYTATWDSTNKIYKVTATGNANDSNLNTKKIESCVNMETGVIKISTNLNDAAPTC